MVKGGGFLDKEKFTSGKFVLAGGVSANSHIRKALSDLCEKHSVKLFVPPLSLCGDNAVMVASQGYYEYLAGKRAGLELNAFAGLDIAQG